MTDSKIDTTEFGFLPIPKHLRFNPQQPVQFGWLLSLTFCFSCTFIVTNLYFCQPILIEMAKSFNVSYSEVARIPTLLQTGYATGLLLITPLGDLVRRRQLLLALGILSSSLTIGLTITHSIVVFEILSFFVGVFTVSPQILIPLAADIAPPNRRASAIAIVLSGLLLGILVARVLAGIVAEFTSWRMVYYVSVGVQYGVLGGMYFLIPDFPAKNQAAEGEGQLTYWGILWTMAKLAVTEPLIVQTAIVNITSMACFTSYWVTLTFLLGGEPYNYSTLVIGLFGLVGILGVATGPFFGRFIDNLLIPYYSALLSTLILIVFQAVQVGAAGVNVGAVVVACFGLDVARQMQQVALTAMVYSISTSARSRINAIFTLSLFIGQVIGTPVGTTVFVRYGWRAQAGLSMGLYVLGLAVILARGPGCRKERWIGWEGESGFRPNTRQAEREALEEKVKEERKEGVNGKGEETDRDSISNPGTGTMQGTEEEKAEGPV